MLTDFLDTIKAHFPYVYFGFQFQPGKAIKSLFIACGFGFILFYFFGFPGSLLLQTALGDAPISWKFLLDALYFLVAPFIINKLFMLAFRVQSVRESFSYLKKFQQSDSEEKKEKLIEQFLNLWFFSPKYIAYQFKLLFNNELLALFEGKGNKMVAKKKLLAFCQSSDSLDRAIERYAQSGLSVLVEDNLTYRLFLCYSSWLDFKNANSSHQTEFFQYCRQRIKDFYCSEVVSLFLPDYKKAVICFINKNIKSEELTKAFKISQECRQIFARFKEEQKEEQKKYIKEFANVLFTSPEAFAAKIAQELNDMGSLEENLTPRKKVYLSLWCNPYCSEEVKNQIATKLTSDFIFWNIYTQLNPFLECYDGERDFIVRLKDHICKEFIPSAFEACFPYHQEGVNLFVQKIKSEAKDSLTREEIIFLDNFVSSFQSSANLEEQKKIIERMMLAIFISPEKFAETFLEHWDNDEPNANEDEVRQKFLTFCQCSGFSSLSEAIREYARLSLDDAIMLTLSNKTGFFQHELDETYQSQFIELFKKYVQTDFGVATRKAYISKFEELINFFVKDIKKEAEEALLKGQQDMLDKNPYELLGIDFSASDDDIKKAYFNKCKKTHPDKNLGDGEANTKFSNVKDAYEFLCDPEKKAKLDEALRIKKQEQEQETKAEGLLFQFVKQKERDSTTTTQLSPLSYR